MEALRPLLSSASLPTHRAVTKRSWASIQRLHTSSPKPATPLPHPTAPGPPPEPPIPAASQAENRIARKLKNAELLRRGQSLRADPAKPGTALKKRFWKDVTVKETPDGYQIFLDSRPVRTASKNILTIPLSKPQLATAIALEWDLLVSAQQALKYHYIPLTSLISRAVDISVADAQGNTKIRDDIVKMLMRYLTTDTLICWVPEKNIHDAVHLEQQRDGTESLRQLQQRTAQPIISYLKAHVWPGVEIVPILGSDSIVPAKQPQMTQDVIRGWLSGLPAWELAGLERGVLATKSLLVAVRLLVEWSEEFAQLQPRSEGNQSQRFGIEEAAEASTTEVRWQTGMWGEVEDTHDVEKEDLRRQLGSVILLVNGEKRQS
ncbi:ATP synthase mitochondrial F1 complex assembly factor 2 [Coniosporium tulheliwenetii]|uniref:ATP synthase mitochondrial F1 complex assembly factor 2 n=1 Tax=Coniosporium tulheliwenetii TaxID=3383036 RepID=A0ACC2YT01_9PEZI|nr:ATP synthase mitochondrial F1 complex assembly factor 2 [Cladosporium sp. JES 115]